MCTFDGHYECVRVRVLVGHAGSLDEEGDDEEAEGRIPEAE